MSCTSYFIGHNTQHKEFEVGKTIWTTDLKLQSVMVALGVEGEMSLFLLLLF